jgi:hypothetical protein
MHGYTFLLQQPARQLNYLINTMLYLLKYKIKMKKVALLFTLLVYGTFVFAQKETFDITTFSAPKAWKKQPGESAIQFTKEDTVKRIYCLITLYKSVPSTANAKENFEMAWASVVKEMVTVSKAPEMQPAETDASWEILSGHAPFENDGNKGIVILVTASGFGKMVNLVMLTNTDAYENEMTAFIESISLKKPELTATETTNSTNSEVQLQQENTSAIADGFKFTTTNFDDGWTSIEQSDWVQATKGNIKVLIHYPNKNADANSTDLLEGLKHAWNILVAPKYSSATNMEFKPLYSWESIEFAEADMVEKATGKKVHVVFFKKKLSGGAGRFLEFVTADKNSFEREFGAYNTDAFAPVWDKMVAMANYNKFAVAASDLKGKWTSSFTGMTQYVNAYTGADAGANTHASNENFEFGTGNTYKWNLSVASGFVGNIKFQNVKSTGKFTALNNWQVSFSDIGGKPKTYNVQFVCIKGARVLWVGDTGFGKIQ